MTLPRIAFQNWIAERQHDCVALARADGLTAQEIGAELRLAGWLENAANPFDPRTPSAPVAQPNWTALGLGSRAEAEGRN